MYDEIEEIRFVANTIRNAGLKAFQLSKKAIKEGIKKDKSPITNIDLATQDFILTKFNLKSSPIKNYNIVAEEESFNKDSQTYFAVDPIDGTKGLISDRDYTVMCGKVLNGKTSFAVVYHPKKQLLFISHKRISVLIDYTTGIIQDMKVSDTSSLSEATILIGYTDSVKRRKIVSELEKHVKVKRFDSTGLKGGLVASGVADGYIMFPREMPSWDLVPPVAIVENSGGKATTFDNTSPDFTRIIVDHGIVLTNGKIHSELLKLVNSIF